MSTCIHIDGFTRGMRRLVHPDILHALEHFSQHCVDVRLDVCLPLYMLPYVTCIERCDEVLHTRISTHTRTSDIAEVDGAISRTL